MMYTVTFQANIDVDAESNGEAVNKACFDATFGTDVYGISLVEVKECERE